MRGRLVERRVLAFSKIINLDPEKLLENRILGVPGTIFLTAEIKRS